MNDEAIVKLRIEMMAAAEHDLEDNGAGKYAINKLRMLPRVVEIMQKSVFSSFWFASSVGDIDAVFGLSPDLLWPIRSLRMGC